MQFRSGLSECFPEEIAVCTRNSSINTLCLKFVIGMLFPLVFVNFFERIVSMEYILLLKEFLSKFPRIQLQFFQLLAIQLI